MREITSTRLGRCLPKLVRIVGRAASFAGSAFAPRHHEVALVSGPMGMIDFLRPKVGTLRRPIQHIISLGVFCYPAWVIKQLGLKRRSYPFDWIFSTPAMVLDILRDDFARFLDASNYRLNPPEGREEGVSEHLHYRDTHGVGAVEFQRTRKPGKALGPPIADEAQSPARDRFGSCLGSANQSITDLVKNPSPFGETRRAR